MLNWLHDKVATVRPEEVAALVQGIDAGQPFQAVHFFPRTDFEGLAYAAHGRASDARLPEAQTRPGGHHVERPRIVFNPVHGLERPD